MAVGFTLATVKPSYLDFIQPVNFTGDFPPWHFNVAHSLLFNVNRADSYLERLNRTIEYDTPGDSAIKTRYGKYIRIPRLQVLFYFMKFYMYVYMKV